MSKSKTKAQISAELKKLRAAYKKKAASKPAYKRSYAKKKSSDSGLASALGGAIGSVVAGAPGRAVGSLVGKGASALMQKVFGSGDYVVTSNSLVKGMDPPSFSKDGRGTIVRHREFISDVSGGTLFNSTIYPIQPGVKSSFPWLSQIAANYEEYIIRGMIFEFKSTSANALNSTNTALGTVIMATRYNVLMPAFTNKVEMENYQYVTTVKPSESAMHPIECAVGESPLHVLYTRTGDTVIGDKRMYDLGNFQISTVGMQASAVIGELWVTYDIELLKPRLSSVSTGFESDHWAFDIVGYGATTQFGTTPVLRSGSNFGSYLKPSSGQIVMPWWPVDYYALVIYCARGTGTTITTAMLPTHGSQLTRQTVWNNNTSDYSNCPAGNNVSNLDFYAIYKFTASASNVEANRTITFNTAATSIGGYTGGDIWIIGVDPPTSAISDVKEPVTLLGAIESKEEKKVACVDPDDSEDEAFAEFMRMKKEKKAPALPVDPSGRDDNVATPSGPFRSRSVK